jgi:hypothetical protein
MLKVKQRCYMKKPLRQQIAKKEKLQRHHLFIHKEFNFPQYNNMVWGPVPHFCPLEALQPGWLTPEVYCTIPVFLIVPTLAARCLSHPQHAVVP